MPHRDQNTLVDAVKAKANRPFRLAQISDCHLPARADTPYRGLRADSGLEAVIGAVVAWQPDAVLLTGDLSEDASEASYLRLAGKIASLKVPVYAVPGNHDLPERMQRYFPQGPYQGPFVHVVGVWKLLLLNSARPGRIDGCIVASDLEELQQSLIDDGPCLLALHHQPVAIASPWIDKYMLEEPEKLLAFVASQPQLKAVVWGHVHQAFETQIGVARFMSAPSAAANSLPQSQRFTPDPAGPACRWLELFADGQLQTGILHTP